MTTTRLLILMFIGLSQISCEKGFLDERPAKALLVPATLQDFQALMDNQGIMNMAPNLSVVSSDDFYSTDNGIQSATVINRNTYLWADDLFEGAYVADWSMPYQQVFYANVILEGLEKMNGISKESSEWKRIRGSALFFRGMAMTNLVHQFAAPYKASTAEQTDGLPIKLNSDVNERPGRGTLQNTYDHIIADLLEAEKLLPAEAIVKSRPAKPAALALLARVFLSMGNFQQAEVFASSCIKLSNQLMDYNSLNLNITNAANPFPQALLNSNLEILFYSGLISSGFFFSTLTRVDSTLFKSYHSNDLRRAALFVDRGNGVINLKGNYTGNLAYFGGIALDEIYLIRAECYARIGKIDAAMSDLNSLLAKRWKKGTFIPFTVSDQEPAVKLILSERRKGMIGRGLRWNDLRRLNSDSRYATTLTRMVNGQTYTLLPDSKRYTLPLPEAEVVGSGFRQNPR